MRRKTKELIKNMKQIRTDNVFQLFPGDYFVDVFDDKGKVIDHVDMSAHCLACAKSDYMAKYGRLVDIRGWHKQGMCGTFLKSMRTTVEFGEES